MGICGAGDERKKPIGLKEQNKSNSKKEYYYILTDSKTQKKYENKIDNNKTLIELLNSLNLKSNGDFTIQFENDLKIDNGKLNDTLDNILIEIFRNKIPEKITMTYSYNGLDIPDDIIKGYINSSSIIGSISETSENYIIIIYERDEKKITPYYFNRGENPNFSFKQFSSFCNAKGCLYISGGEEELRHEPEKSAPKFNEFLCIDLNQIKENRGQMQFKELPNLIEARAWHNMIYVPDNYIFIVGGENTRTVEMYNIEKNEITKDSELNQIRSECTLCLVNNKYLYAFFGFVLHQEFDPTIERCNLLKEERKWDFVDIMEKEGFLYNISFFGVSYYKDDEIILIGVNDIGDEKHYDYIYKIGKNENDKDEINECNCNINEGMIVFKEKLFFPVDDNISINIPLIIGDDIKYYELNRDTREIKVINYQK